MYSAKIHSRGNEFIEFRRKIVWMDLMFRLMFWWPVEHSAMFDAQASVSTNRPDLTL